MLKIISVPEQISDSKKDYIVNLHTARSKRALAAAIMVSVCTFVAVSSALSSDDKSKSSFIYFTTLSNLLSAAGAMFMIPYAVEGIRKKRFTMPRWIMLFQYAGAVSVFITLFCAVTIISFTLGPRFAFRGRNFWLHLVTPVQAIILFLAVETNQKITRKDSAIALIPFWAYGVLYFVMVILIGKDRGGWPDIYQTTSRLPVWVVFLLMFAIGYAAAIFLRKIHNRVLDRSVRNLTGQWEGLDSAELESEAFGLGRYMSRHLDKSEIIIPMDILELMSQKCKVSTEDLSKAYIKGVEEGLKDLMA